MRTLDGLRKIAEEIERLDVEQLDTSQLIEIFRVGGFGKDPRTFRNWIGVALAFKVLVKSKPGKVTLYGRGPNFKDFISDKTGEAVQ